MTKEHIKLSESDREHLEKTIRNGSASAKVYKRSLGLLAIDRGKTYTELSQLVGVTKQTVSVWARTYWESALDCLGDRPRAGRPPELSRLDSATITVLACSKPAEGRRLRDLSENYWNVDSLYMMAGLTQ